MALSTTAALAKDKYTARTRSGTMQHRHFAAIASILAGMPDEDGRDCASRLFACELSRTNPNFNRARFLKACGVEA